MDRDESLQDDIATERTQRPDRLTKAVTSREEEEEPREDGLYGLIEAQTRVLERVVDAMNGGLTGLSYTAGVDIALIQRLGDEIHRLSDAVEQLQADVRRIDT